MTTEKFTDSDLHLRKSKCPFATGRFNPRHVPRIRSGIVDTFGPNPLNENGRYLENLLPIKFAHSPETGSEGFQANTSHNSTAPFQSQPLYPNDIDTNINETLFNSTDRPLGVGRQRANFSNINYNRQLQQYPHSVEAFNRSFDICDRELSEYTDIPPLLFDAWNPVTSCSHSFPMAGIAAGTGLTQNRLYYNHDHGRYSGDDAFYGGY